MRRLVVLMFLGAVLLAGCSGSAEDLADVAVMPTETVPTETPLPTEQIISTLSEDEIRTLSSLTLVDDYPLYTMIYSGDYSQAGIAGEDVVIQQGAGQTTDWACTLFTSLLDLEGRLYGRNFDWEHSPAVLLITDPPDGFSSVTMVDIAYLGFAGENAFGLEDAPLEDLAGLLDAPWWPFDGMNEAGVAIGMAAVPTMPMPTNPENPTAGSLQIMRLVLDSAKNVDEAVAIFEGHNIDMEGGPWIHYLVSDRYGDAALIEFYNGEMRVLRNENPWHMATNFLCSANEGMLEGNCWRYDTVLDSFRMNGGSMTIVEALGLLEDVSQGNTQWSVVYRMNTGQVSVVMGQDYGQVHKFAIGIAE